MRADEISFIVPARRADGPTIDRIRRMIPSGSELVVSTVSGGAAHARNVGARYTRRESRVLVFIDDDVQLKADWTSIDVDGPWGFAVPEWYSIDPSIRTYSSLFYCSLLNLTTQVFRYPLSLGFTCVRRVPFELVGGYPTNTTHEEPALVMKLLHHGFPSTHIPVRVTMLRRWSHFGRLNDATSRNKVHPEPKPGEVIVYKS